MASTLPSVLYSRNSNVSVHFLCLSLYGTKQSCEFIDTYFVRVRIQRHKGLSHTL